MAKTKKQKALIKEINEPTTYNNVEIIDSSNFKVNMEAITENINRLVKASGRMKTSIASEVGVSGATLTMWCNGRRIPTRKNLLALANALGVAEADFYRPEDNSKNKRKPITIKVSKRKSAVPGLFSEKALKAMQNEAHSMIANNKIELRLLQVDIITNMLNQMKEDELDQVENLCKEILRKR